MTASLLWRCSLTRCSPLRVWQLWQYIDCPFVVVLIVKYLPHRYKHPCRAARSATVWMRANPSPANARPHAVDAAFLPWLARVAKWAQAVDNIAICRYMPDWLYMMALDVGFYRLNLARRHWDDVSTASAALTAFAADGIVDIWAHQDILYRATSKMLFLHVCHLSVTSQNGISSSGIFGPKVWSCLPPETAPVVWPKPPAGGAVAPDSLRLSRNSISSATISVT